MPVTFTGELESDFLCLSTDIEEIDCMPVSETKAELLVSYLLPAFTADFKRLHSIDLDLCGSLRVVRTLESNAVKVNFVLESDLDPGVVVILYHPLVPVFLVRTKEILWSTLLSAFHALRVLSKDGSCGMQMMSQGGLELFHCLRTWLIGSNAHGRLEEQNFSQLQTAFVLIVELESDLGCFSVDF